MEGWPLEGLGTAAGGIPEVRREADAHLGVPLGGGPAILLRCVVFFTSFLSFSIRLLVERLAHLVLLSEGGKLVVELCACAVRHREYFEFESVGGFAKFRARMKMLVVSMEEKAECVFFDPCPSTKDIYELITRS